jgi:hypothetical protein
MKKVLKSMAILLLGVVFVFGCTAPTSEDGVTGSSDVEDALGAWQWTVDLENARVDIESAAGTGAVAIIDGHTVEIQSSNCVDAGGNVLQCDVTVTNRDVEDAMWDIRTRINNSTNAAAIMNDADYTWPGPTIIAPPNSSGTTAPINESGFCFTETGRFPPVLLSPYVNEGCPSYVRNSLATPYQYVHPRCGSVTTNHLFENVPFAPGSEYRFWVELSATWIPENGADPRRDGDYTGHGFAIDGGLDHRTMIVNVNDLNLKAGVDPTYPVRYWKWGSSYLSNNLDDAQFVNGQYFAVEVAYEYPDRIENDPNVGLVAAQGGSENYEYYDNLTFAIIWDDAVITKVPADDHRRRDQDFHECCQAVHGFCQEGIPLI